MKLNWILSDVTAFLPSASYDYWHDRATFHFLTTADNINTYVSTARQVVNGFMIIGTFSEKEPDKCRMLDVHQYTE